MDSRHRTRCLVLRASPGLLRIFRLVVLTLALGNLPGYGASSGSLELSWATGSGVAGYRVYRGSASGTYVQVYDVGLTNRTVISGLLAGQTNYFAVTAYTVAGFESRFSTEVVGVQAPSSNSPPVVTGPVSLTVLEDTPGSVTLRGSDPDGGALTYQVTQAPANGTLTGTAPNLVYLPRLNFNGTDAFRFRVSDGMATSAVTTVSIQVNAVNDAPVALAQVISTPARTAVSVTLTGTDVEGDPLTYAVTTRPAKGKLTGRAPSLTYTPNVGASGLDTFQFVARDSLTSSAPATITINIASAALASLVQAKGVETRAGPPMDPAVIVVLPGSRAETLATGERRLPSREAGLPTAGRQFTLVRPPRHGEATVNSDGTFLYVHGGEPAVDGDEFSYESVGADGVREEGLVQVQVFRVTVLSADDESDVPVLLRFPVTPGVTYRVEAWDPAAGGWIAVRDFLGETTGLAEVAVRALDGSGSRAYRVRNSATWASDRLESAR